MLSLPDVTLCAVDTRHPHWVLPAMRRSMQNIRFGDAVLFTALGLQLGELPPGLRVVELDHVNSVQAYSRFMLQGLLPYLQTKHHLIVQWDGYVLDSAMWRDEFLTRDYIGAVWPQYRDGHRVGNGGFSLRSRRLLEAFADTGFEAGHPEDVCLARTHRTLLEQGYGIRFADETMAHAFSFERLRGLPSSFGFHGLSNFPDVMTAEEVSRFVNEASNDLFAGVEARRLVKNLLRHGLVSEAHEAMRKRGQATTSHGWADLRLHARIALSRWINHRPSI